MNEKIIDRLKFFILKKHRLFCRLSQVSVD